jgi:hypothetical protein
LIDGDGLVRGEIYRLDDLNFSVLDREEGYNFERRPRDRHARGRRRARA